MPVSDGYLEFVLDQLGRIAPVRARRMFGGVGIYSGDLFFALVDDDALFFKVDESNRADYERAGMGPWEHGKGYYELPVEVLEDVDRLRAWVEKAVAVAERKRK